MTEPRGARVSFMSFVAEKPKVALSILIGAVAFCGLLNALLFFSAFNINAQSESLPPALRKRPADELLPSGGLLAQRVDELAASLNEIRSRLASVERSAAEPVIVAMSPAPEQTLKPACAELPGAEFLFEHASDDLDVEEKERNRNAMQAVIGYFRSDQTVFARGDYVLVVGHADVSGDVVHNQRLSERRAQATVQRLLKILTVWIGPVADRMYPIAAGEGAKAWEEDPSTDGNRRTLVYHCRGDHTADPGPSVADEGTVDDGMNGHARLTPSRTSPVDSLEIN
jgi:outer membrane protein OmpA-like peptidoglycan-associated protein